MMEMARTTKSGPQAVSGPRGLMIEIDCRIPMKRK